MDVSGGARQYVLCMAAGLSKPGEWMRVAPCCLVGPTKREADGQGLKEQVVAAELSGFL